MAAKAKGMAGPLHAGSLAAQAGGWRECPLMRGLEIRLSKLESRRRPAGSLYFVWGRTDQELDAALERAIDNGELGPSDPNVCILCLCEPVPASGWRDYRRLSERERADMKASIRRIALAARDDGQGCSESAADKREAAKLTQMPLEQLYLLALGRKLRNRHSVH